VSVRLVETIGELRKLLQEARRRGQSIGLVPTMGALHAGHLKLMEEARKRDDIVVVTIFVNPTQFNQQEDFKNYPRPLSDDLKKCSDAGVDFVFAPSLEEMYPSPPLTMVAVAELTKHLCGPFRPGHFEGVATVVAKLFHIVQADRAYFGQKDAQQFAVIQRMARDLNIPIEIVPVETVREPDGLAFSSRNRRLTLEQRQAATVLFRALRLVEREIQRGVALVEAAKRPAVALIGAEPLARFEYLDVADPETLHPVANVTGPALIAGAIWIGDVRLIDNIRVSA
jgi:pantoate--beta-alanine ligase